MDIDGIRRPAAVRRNIKRVAAKTQPASANGFKRSRPQVRIAAGTRGPAFKQNAGPGPAAKSAARRGASAVRKDFTVPGYQPPKRPAKLVRRRLTKRMVALRVTVVALAVLIGTSGFLGWRAYANLHKVFHGSKTVAALTNQPVTPDLLKGEGDSRVNILLLGIGGPGHDGPDLTDTIVVLSVDPVNNTATMLSVPRDLWVQQPVPYFGKQQKINAAYESGKYHAIGHLDATNKDTAAVEAGFDNIDQVVKNVLDVNINYHVLVNFQAFRQAVDTVGGITVDVPTQLYDPTMAWENHWNPVLAPAGVQQMDGVKALLYARSRETTSDFARAERQRQILVALKDKVLSAGTLSNPAKINGLMNAFGNNVYSDLSTQAAVHLVGIMQKIGDTNVTSLGLSEEPHKLVVTDHVGNISVDRPVAGFDNYADIQAYVHSQLPDGYLVKEHAPIAVLAPTQAAADATAAMLKSYGYNVTAATAATVPITATTVVDLSAGKKLFTRHYLEDRFDVKAVTGLPDGVTLPAGSGAKFVIMVTK